MALPIDVTCSTRVTPERIHEAMRNHQRNRGVTDHDAGNRADVSADDVDELDDIKHMRRF